jgi:hypothetical protein
VSPYPFDESPARFSLVRRLIGKDTRSDVLATPAERVAITVER